MYLCGCLVSSVTFITSSFSRAIYHIEIIPLEISQNSFISSKRIPRNHMAIGPQMVLYWLRTHEKWNEKLRYQNFVIKTQISQLFLPYSNKITKMKFISFVLFSFIITTNYAIWRVVCCRAVELWSCLRFWNSICLNSTFHMWNFNRAISLFNTGAGTGSDTELGCTQNHFGHFYAISLIKLFHYWLDTCIPLT